MKKFFIILLILIFNCTVCLAKTEPKERFDFAQIDKEPSLSEYAMISYGENNNEDALAYLLKIKEDDRTPQDWLILGNILQDNGKNADAIFMYNRAVLIDKKYYKAYYNIGNMYLDEEKYNLAIQNYKQATKYNDKFPYSYYNLGCAYLRSGNLKKAKYAFLKAIEIKNTIPEFHYNLAYVYKKLNNEKSAKQYLDNYNKLMLGY